MALRQPPPLLQQPRGNAARGFAAAAAAAAARPSLGSSSSRSSSSAALLALGAAGSPRITMRVASKGAYICRDCGYIYSDRTPFDKLPDKYFCPVCGAPKRRFKPYDTPVGRNANDTKVRKARKAELKQGGNGAALPIGIAIGLGVLVGTYIYLNSQF